MMKLLYVTNGITGSGGLERVLSVKSDYLTEQMGYEVHIVTLNEAGKSTFFNFNPKLHRHDISVKGNIWNKSKSYLKGIKAVVKKLRPDLISVCDDGLKGFLLPLWIGKPCPIIYERHASVLLNFKNMKASVLRGLINKIQHQIMIRAAKRFDCFVVLTAGNRREWPLENISVIANPLPFRPAPVTVSREKKVIAVGSQSYNKGYDLLLHAWQKIKSLGEEDWILEVYGKENKSLMLPALAEQLHIGSSVAFHEALSPIENVYRSASVLALSSRSEGFGMVLAEAMAYGIPCVAFDCPHGPADIIKDGIDGFLLPPGDTAAFAEKIRLLMEDEALREKMGAAARVNVQRFRPEIIMKEWDLLFKRLKR